MNYSSFFDLIRSRKMMALLILGFASGLPAQALEGPLQLWLKDQKVDPLQITTIGAMATFPYAWKFIWSPFIDRFDRLPFFGRWGRRQGWLILTQSILIVLLLLMSIQNPSPENLTIFTIIAVAIGFVSASQDIASDAYRTDVLETRETAIGGALSTNGFRIAILIAGNLIIALADKNRIDRWSWSQIYLLIAGLLLLGVIASLWAPQPDDENQNNRPDSLKEAAILPFLDFIDRKKKAGGAAILMFVLTYKLGDYMVKSVAKIFLKDIGFSLADIAQTGSIGIIAAIIGAICGGIMVLKIGMNRSLWIAAIGLSIGILPYAILAQVHQPDLNLLLLAVSVESFAAGLEAAVFVAFLTSLCKPRFSATQFALFSSFMLAGRSLVSGPMGGIYQGLGSVSFFWISIIAAVPSLILLLYVAPLSIENVIKSGFKAVENNDLNSAIDDFSHAIDLNSGNFESYKQRGLARARLGDKLKDRGSSYPDEIGSPKAKANYYRDAIDYYRDAIKDCDRSIKINPTTNDLSEELIKILHRASETLDLAIELSDRHANTLDKRDANTYVTRAEIRSRLGNLEGSIADLDRAIELDKHNANTYATRGEIRSRLDDLPGAIADLDRAIELDKHNANTYATRGKTRARSGDLPGAIADLKLAIKLTPDRQDFVQALDRIQSA